MQPYEIVILAWPGPAKGKKRERPKPRATAAKKKGSVPFFRVRLQGSKIRRIPETQLNRPGPIFKNRPISTDSSEKSASESVVTDFPLPADPGSYCLVRTCRTFS
jgi:hypothetical protein